MAANSASSGYGPSKKLYFDGEESNYEVWEVKFLSYLRLQKLHKYVLTGGDTLRTTPVPAAAGATAAQETAAAELG